jgi:hypothetical protein
VGVLRKSIAFVFAVFFVSLLVSCTHTTYTSTCIKEEVEMVFVYNDRKVLSYKITNESGELVESEFIGNYNDMLASIATAEEFGAVCTISTNE